MVSWRSFKAGSFFLAFIAIFAFLIISGPKASATINSQINFQGKLTNTNGTNVANGTYSIVFSIYTVSSGGSSVWTETQPSVSVTDGIFQVALGSVTSLPGSVDFNSSSLYLGIKVGGDAEMTPRVQFTAAPYAFNAQNLGGISSGGFAQLGLASAQSETSTNSLIFLNKTSTGNLIQLQQGAVNKFVVDNSGILTTASVNSSSIVDGAVALNDLAGDSVDSSKIVDASVSANDVVANTFAQIGITTAQLDSSTNSMVFLNKTGASGNLAQLQQGGTDKFAVSFAGLITTASVNSASIVDGAVTGTDITANTIDFNDLADSMSVDASTTIALGANNLAFNVTGVGDFIIQDGGVTAFQVDSSGNTFIGDPGSAGATGSIIVLDSITADPAVTAGGMYYNSSSAKFRCAQGSAWTDCISPWITIRKTSAQNVVGTTLTNDTALTFSVAAATTYAVRFYICYTGDAAAADYKGSFTFPAAIAAKNVSGRYTSTSTADAIQVSTGVLGATTAWPTAAGLAMGTAAVTTDKRIFEGYFSFQPNSAGTFVYRFAQNAAGGTTGAQTCANSYLEYQAL